MSTIYIENAEKLNNLLAQNKLKLSKNKIPLVINQIEEDDADNYSTAELTTIDGQLYAVTEATEGDTVDSVTGAGHYILIDED